MTNNTIALDDADIDEQIPVIEQASQRLTIEQRLFVVKSLYELQNDGHRIRTASACEHSCDLWQRAFRIGVSLGNWFTIASR
jgi:hypothetical protein